MKKIVLVSVILSFAMSNTALACGGARFERATAGLKVLNIDVSTNLRGDVSTIADNDGLIALAVAATYCNRVVGRPVVDTITTEEQLSCAQRVEASFPNRVSLSNGTYFYRGRTDQNSREIGIVDSECNTNIAQQIRDFESSEERSFQISLSDEKDACVKRVTDGFPKKANYSLNEKVSVGFLNEHLASARAVDEACGTSMASSIQPAIQSHQAQPLTCADDIRVLANRAANRMQDYTNEITTDEYLNTLDQPQSVRNEIRAEAQRHNEIAQNFSQIIQNQNSTNADFLRGLESFGELFANREYQISSNSGEDQAPPRRRSSRRQGPDYSPSVRTAFSLLNIDITPPDNTRQAPRVVRTRCGRAPTEINKSFIDAFTESAIWQSRPGQGGTPAGRGNQ